jgi:cytochrome b subunit of formate dehydrogenase
VIILAAVYATISGFIIVNVSGSTSAVLKDSASKALISIARDFNYIAAAGGLVYIILGLLGLLSLHWWKKKPEAKEELHKGTDETDHNLLKEEIEE